MVRKIRVSPVVVNGEDLSIEDIVKVARFRHRVVLSEGARERIRSCRKEVEMIVRQSRPVYGLNTGFGSLSKIRVSDENIEKLQVNLVTSHAVGVGRPLNEETVRAVMLLRVNTFAKGFSGVRLETAQVLVEMLNRDVYPFVPEKGSVGSSGDLAPLSHIILVMLGKGEAFVRGKRVSGREAMKKAGLRPVRLSFKEGLALNNGTPVMTAIAALAVHDAENLARNSIIAAGISLEALKANSSFLQDIVHVSRPHPGQMVAAREIKSFVSGSSLMDSVNEKVQDAYSIRATPVVIGASLDAIRYVREKVLIEANSVTDNPIIHDGQAFSAANFHGQHLALAMDFLGIALCELANISERRIARMLDPALSEGLPAFLVRNSGLNSGFMITQYTAAALVSENKILAHPASVDSIPTCANQEDHVSMGTIAARKAREILGNAENVVAIELMVACQAVEMRKECPGMKAAAVIRAIRSEVRPVEEDRVLYMDVNAVRRMIQERALFRKTGISVSLEVGQSEEMADVV